MKKQEKRTQYLFGGLFLVFFICISLFNIRYMGKYLTSDMYGDLWVSKLMWEQRTLFPEGWVFGNQLYVLATPNFAALFYGLTHNMLLSMGLASTLMVALFAVAYYWMLKTTFSVNQILIGLVIPFACFCTTHIGYNQFAQLYFVGCTYYICYLITLLINVGVFIRLYSGQKVNIVIYLISLITSLAMGIQSIRQTLIMVMPFIFVGICLLIYSKIKKNKQNIKLFVFIALTSVFNLAGVILSKKIDVERDAIVGSMTFSPFSDISLKVSTIINHVKSVMGLDDFVGYILRGEGSMIPSVLTAVCSFIIFFVFVYCIILLFKNNDLENNAIFICFILFVSCLAVFGAFLAFDMTRLSKYYFIYYLLVSIVISSQYKNCKKIVKAALILQIVLVLAVSYITPMVKMELKPSVFTEIADYCEENGYEIVYSDWDNAGNVAGASNCRIVAGRWDASDIFTIKAHTNIMDVYSESDNEKAVYIFTDESLKEAELYISQNQLEASFERLATFEDENGNAKYLYKSDRQLMR
jgi:hypothetical protein